MSREYSDQAPDKAPTGSNAVAEIAPTSLDPYGQLLRMLQPRAHNIAIHDRNGLLLWSADACASDEVNQLVQDYCNENRNSDMAAASATAMTGEALCILPIQESGQPLIGVVAITSDAVTVNDRIADSTSRLLRPALCVLARELNSQYNIDSLQRDIRVRDKDLTLLLDEASSLHKDQHDADDFVRLLTACLGHLDCSLGALLVPDKNITVYRAADGMPAATTSSLLSRTHRHLFALAQVQRRTVSLNNRINVGPLANLRHKILASPVLGSSQRVVGVLVFYKLDSSADFSLREIHLVELLSRRISQILLNSYDSATGLLTRASLEKRAADALRIEADTVNSADHFVIYADIDHLHIINDTYGMHIGDEVITRIASIIRGVTSPNIAAAKISGDRFALFLQDADLGTATHLAETLCRSVRQMNFSVGNRKLDVSTSFGLTSVQTGSHSLSHALAGAEAACKAAKDRGRDRVEVFVESDHSIIRRVEDVALIGSIREALAHHRFRMVAQPIVSLDGQDDMRPRAKYELLLRMVDAAGQQINPEKFFLAAERYQMVAAIDRWVVGFVLETLSGLVAQLEKTGATFAINLSGQSIGDDEFLDYLFGKLREFNLPPSLISFELTETAAVSNIVRVETMMRKLRQMGHEIALDDFGKGLSSLSYLQSLPVSSVKIDGSLIRDVTTNVRSQAMIRAVVELTRSMNLKTTAECIESDAIRKMVTSLGVDDAQGYAIGRPEPLDGVLNALLERSASMESCSMPVNRPALVEPEKMSKAG